MWHVFGWTFRGCASGCGTTATTSKFLGVHIYLWLWHNGHKQSIVTHYGCRTSDSVLFCIFEGKYDAAASFFPAQRNLYILSSKKIMVHPLLGGEMKIFSRQTIFFCVFVCANNFFPAASFCRQFFLYTTVSNQWSRLVMMMMTMAHRLRVCALFSKFSFSPTVMNSAIIIITFIYTQLPDFSCLQTIYLGFFAFANNFFRDF